MVFKYHHISPLPENNLNYRPDTFDRQITYMLNQGYQCISAEEMYFQVFLKKKIKKKQFVITFDDGYLDNYLYAYTILKKHNIPATIFLTTSLIADNDQERNCDNAVMKDDNDAFIESLKKRYESYLNWTEIEDMHKSGLIDFEPHGHYHRYIYVSDKIEYYNIGKTLYESFKLKSLEDNTIKIGSDVFNSGPSLAYRAYDPHTRIRETDWQAYKRFVDEIGISKKMIEEKLEKHCDFFSWPWGKFCHSSVNAAKYLGFKMIFTSYPGTNSRFTNHFYIKRFNPCLNDKIFRKQVKKFSNFLLSLFNR